MPLLAFSAVSKRWRDGGHELVALERVSFALEHGASMGLYGERRSGKSTLLRIAAGVEPADSGGVRFAGRELGSASSIERARLLRGPIALLGGEGWLPSPGETIMDHVAMAAGSAGLSLREARRRALAALECAGVVGSSLQEATASLAPAERARVMLARALVREPRLLLVDEPCPMPNLGDRDRFCALLRTLARERGIALLVASEDMAALQGMDVLACISAGELCSTEQDPATVVQLPRRRSVAHERT
jgi:putative ABC transport system ATP-binding protein